MGSEMCIRDSTSSLSEDQQDILKKRGVLSPEEIHKLAHKGEKSACHSDLVEGEEEAKGVQDGLLAQP